MDRIAGMEAFVAVVEAGGFHGAAKQLGVSRALVSKRVAALEKTLGSQLLHRTTRRLAVTPPGAAFYERCRRVVDEFQLAAAELAQLQLEPKGPLRVNGPMSFGQRHLAPALIDFMRLHPGITVQLTLTDRFVDPIEEGFDIVLRIGELRDSSLITRQLGLVRRVLCASPAYLRRAGTPRRPQDLPTHRLLHYGWLVTGTRWHLIGPDGEVTVDGPGSLCVNNGEVLQAAALAGLGVVLLPTFIVGPSLEDGDLIRVLPGYEAPPHVLHALWPASRLLPASLRAFIDFLVERFGGEPPRWERAATVARSRP